MEKFDTRHKDAMNFGWGLHVFRSEESSDWSSLGLIVTTQKGFTYHVNGVMSGNRLYQKLFTKKKKILEVGLVGWYVTIQFAFDISLFLNEFYWTSKFNNSNSSPKANVYQVIFFFFFGLLWIGRYIFEAIKFYGSTFEVEKSQPNWLLQMVKLCWYKKWSFCLRKAKSKEFLTVTPSGIMRPFYIITSVRKWIFKIFFLKRFF